MALIWVALSSYASSTKTVGEKRLPLSVNDHRRFDYFFFEACSQQAQGNYAAAFDLFEHARTINPQAAEVYYNMAPYYMTMGKDSVALASILRAANLNPDNITYQQRVADHYLSTKNYPAAIAAYENLYEHDHRNTEILRSLLSLYQASNQYDKMLYTLNRLETQEGESEEFTLAKMRVYEMMDDKKAAYGVLHSLVVKHPNDFLYRTMLGNWLMQNDRTKEAYHYFTDVLKEDPDNATALASLYDYYVEVDDKEQASRLMTRILSSPKTDQDTKITLLRQYLSGKDINETDSSEVMRLFDLALSTPQPNADIAEFKASYMYMRKMPEDSLYNAFQKVVDLAPDNAQARLQLVLARWGKQDYNGVIALCLPAQQYNPDEMVFYYFAGLAYYQKDEPDSTLTTFRKGIAQINDKTDPNMASDIYAIMGDVLYQKGEKQAAFEAYDKSLSYKEDNVATLNNYAYYLSLENKDLHRAEQMSYKTIKAEPKNATYLDTYAWILFMQERYAEAKIYIDQALQTMDSTDLSGSIYDHVGDIYYMNGLKDEAVTYWGKAVEQDNTLEVALWKRDNKKYITEQEYKKKWKKDR